jgi:hypothetical protein
MMRLNVTTIWTVLAFLFIATMSAIDDYAERETGNREYFWGKPHKAG